MAGDWYKKSRIYPQFIYSGVIFPGYKPLTVILTLHFLNNKKNPTVEKWSIQEELTSFLNTDIDLVDLKDATVILRVEVVENGIRIYSVAPFKYDNFETTTYSLFSDLNESRIDIINDL